jgi:hypothetical protein
MIAKDAVRGLGHCLAIAECFVPMGLFHARRCKAAKPAAQTKADIAAFIIHVRFTPNSDRIAARPLCAINRHMHCSISATDEHE